MTDPGRPVLELRECSKVYTSGQDVHALRAASATIYVNDFVAIVGPSGSGKSTLLNILGLLDQPTSGSYILAGFDTSGLTDSQRTKLRAWAIGFVFQSFRLVSKRSVLDNVSLALVYRGVRPTDARKVSEEMLERVGMAHRSYSFPETLSGGEQQRVAIARALVKNPSIVLCDEPTGNLDTQNSEQIVDLLRRANSAGSTIVLITHDRSVASAATRELDIRDGILTERGHAATCA